jgi:hypothetical protein
MSTEDNGKGFEYSEPLETLHMQSWRRPEKCQAPGRYAWRLFVNLTQIKTNTFRFQTYDF